MTGRFKNLVFGRNSVYFLIIFSFASFHFSALNINANDYWESNEDDEEDINKQNPKSTQINQQKLIVEPAQTFSEAKNYAVRFSVTSAKKFPSATNDNSIVFVISCAVKTPLVKDNKADKIIIHTHPDSQTKNVESINPYNVKTPMDKKVLGIYQKLKVSSNEILNIIEGFIK